MLVIPSIDLERGRSRVVFWPGAAAGVGAPTDRPERIAEQFARLGARVIHLVDFDGARRGRPMNLEAVGAIASRVAVPLQLAGGLEGPDHVRLAFAAGATRAVVSMAVAARADLLRECLAVAGDWLAVGLDARLDRIAAFPWGRATVPTPEELVGELLGAGVRRFVLSHGSDARLERIVGLARAAQAEVVVAGGVSDLAALDRLRRAGVSGVIVGEALYSGAIDLAAAMETAA